ncbi:MAG TPA: hypothetical protein VFR97_10275 [Capillimicrobium sp.]|nr:hypothetical protein [Capillimicrobium sp.]
MTLAFVNARLLQVNGDGLSANYGRPATGGTPLWEGDEDALVRDRELERTAADRRAGGADLVDVFVETTLTVALLYGADGSAFTPQPGQTVTLEHRGVSTLRKVESVVVDDALGEVRMTLVDA